MGRDVEARSDVVAQLILAMVNLDPPSITRLQSASIRPSERRAAQTWLMSSDFLSSAGRTQPVHFPLTVLFPSGA
jgi:hypothetical protein